MSGTGNTLRVARWMADVIKSSGARQLAQEGCEGPIQTGPETGEDCLRGLLSPAHGFTAFWPMIRLACRLPRGRKAHAFVAVSRAGTKLGPWRFPGMEGTACYLLTLILLLKGYRVRGVLGIDMPSNWIACHPGFGPAAAADIIAHARPRAERFLRHILAGKTWFRPGSLVCLFLGLVLLPISVAYLLAGRFFLAKLFFANHRCTGCGRCAENCPFGAIRTWGKRRQPYWTFYCESCMRCMAYCPSRAVEAGHSWGVLLWFGATIPIGVWLLDRLSAVSPWAAWLDHPAAHLVAAYLYFLFAVFVAYLLFSLLICVPAINALFTYTTLTHYYRRYHEPDTGTDDLPRSSATGVRGFEVARFEWW